MINNLILQTYSGQKNLFGCQIITSVCIRLQTFANGYSFDYLSLNKPQIFIKMEEKNCLECNEPLRGRIDKKYCSDACRNAYNNKLNTYSYNMVRKTNRILAKNHKILNELNPTGKTTRNKSDLINLGFDFNLLTSIYKTKDGKLYQFCYDQGYLELDNNKILLVKREI